MDPLGATFFTSSLIVKYNAIKNVIFRIATITLDFVILRLFGFIAFQYNDYTSFLMFAEDAIQKALFISSRGLTTRQSLLAGMFALVAAAGGLYDTMLWAIDNPGYVTRTSLVNGESLVAQMVDSPSYVTLITANRTNPSAQNNLNSTFNADLYKPGLNFTLPGVYQEGATEVAPPLYPLNPWNGTARIWLDGVGFAVGLDFTFMTTVNMSRSLDTACLPLNPPNETVTQIWNCNVPNSEGLAMFLNLHGQIPIWWDSYHLEFLLPQKDDNPWASLGSGGATVMMKQIFTITKGRRRHTFITSVTKATMTATAPSTLDDGEISDFMRKTWSPDGTITAGVQDLINVVLSAKGNNTGRTFGTFVQMNTSLSSTSTDYLNILDGDGHPYYTALRFSSTTTTLTRSEILDEEPTPFEPCPGVVYHNFAVGGTVRSTNCNSPELVNQTLPSGQGFFLGQIDTSAVTILNGFLGDGTSNLSSVALTDSGLDWVGQHMGQIDGLLTSRALLLGGKRSDVVVYVEYNVAAISALQLVLCILPIALAIVAWCLTRDKAMSYYQNSFLSAVLATTHITTTSCKELGYIHPMPEITLQRKGRHVTLGTADGGMISSTLPKPADEQELVYEPLILEEESM